MSNKLFAKSFKPLTINQVKMSDEIDRGQHVIAYGAAGSGKTFGLVNKAMNLIEKGGRQDGLLIIRSTVSVRDQGFLPGNLEEKEAPYLAPYIDIFSEIYNMRNAFSLLKGRSVDFKSTSHTRGVTFRNKIILIDEAQNLTFQELYTISTRLDNSCKLFISGDFYQSDLDDKDKKGIIKFLEILKSIKDISLIKFGHNDIVRSGLVKKIIIAKERYEKRQLKAMENKGK